MRPFCRIRVPGSRLSHTSVSVHFIIALKKCLADQTKRMSLAAVLSWQLGTQMVSLATLATDGSSRCHRLLKMSSPFYKLRRTIQSQLAKAQSKAQLPTKPTETA